MKNRWQLLLLVLGVLVCVGAAQTQQGHVVLRDVGLYETPATYTELAFNQPAELPATLKKANTVISVSFNIHNVSNVGRAYQWSIAVVRSGKSQVKTSGTLESPAQGQTVITRSVDVSCSGGRVQVVVGLASPAQSIGFWLTCPSATKTQAKQ